MSTIIQSLWEEIFIGYKNERRPIMGSSRGTQGEFEVATGNQLGTSLSRRPRATKTGDSVSILRSSDQASKHFLRTGHSTDRVMVSRNVGYGSGRYARNRPPETDDLAMFSIEKWLREFSSISASDFVGQKNTEGRGRGGGEDRTGVEGAGSKVWVWMAPE